MAVVPEPSTALLLCLGLMVLTTVRWNRLSYSNWTGGHQFLAIVKWLTNFDWFLALPWVVCSPSGWRSVAECIQCQFH